ncbi:DUF1064 domain-containing protein [Robbsia sp. Bb-Pol-6]|uniref:DUF1064 domain-containing protein n=1 Tax=Robbsia betulipollinis TaxID=2981849 RepID=A0ABT3ZUV0_9BURK|nr:DUF1064 domain-containing protein [Robbsia betulipollinis]MCY0389613.1 DUF1064 domain-containing protein [Robbsia betulipollinis]
MKGWPRVPDGATHVGTARINAAPTVSAPRPHPAAQPAPKPAKYGNTKVNVDGHEFDSAKESRRYRVLKVMEEAGEIGKLTMQHVFLLVPAQRRADGRAERKVEYRADFSYVEGGELVVEDVKSEITRKTKDYVIKRKLMLQVHGISIREVN